MATSKIHSITTPIVSKMYCSSTTTLLVVRRRPQTVGGGGFVVTNCGQKVVFRVDGCGILGKKGELIVRNGNGDALLLIRQKGGMVQALSINKQWKGYTIDYEGAQKLVFCMKEPNSCFSRNHTVRISVHPNTTSHWDFEVNGYFPDRNCTIVDSHGDISAQIGIKEEIEKEMRSKDVYHVVVKPGIDQAFVFGVIAVLDYMHHESTRLICFHNDTLLRLGFPRNSLLSG